MQTSDFARGIHELIKLAERSPTSVMCAEAVSWRCHRSLVGDALLVQGVEVLDIMTEKHTPSHSLTSFAHVEGKMITYPAEE